MFNSPLRRAATVLAGALIGLGGAAVVSAPASAHDTAVSGKAVCDTATGTRTVTWTLTNDYPTERDRLAAGQRAHRHRRRGPGQLRHPAAGRPTAATVC